MMVGNDLETYFWEDLWLGDTRLNNRFSKLFPVSLIQNTIIADCGFWDGLLWNWSLIWRDFFEWELESLNEL